MSDQPENATVLSDYDAERALIGAVLGDNGLLERCGIRAEDFFDKTHADLWRAAATIIRRGDALSPAVLASAFPECRNYIARLPTNPAGEGAASTIRDFASRRALVDAANNLLERAGDTTASADEIAADAMGRLSAVSAAKPMLTKRMVAEQIVAGMGKRKNYYSTGLAPLDKAMGGGLMEGKCYGFNARKKVGKSILLSTISHNLNRNGVLHALLTLEMTPAQMEERNIARDGGFNAMQFLKQSIPDLSHRVADYAVSVPDFTIYEHAPGATFNEVRSIIGRARLKGIKGIILDYLQLVGGKAKNETEEYHHRTVAQWLADTARKTGMFMVVAAQLNQEGNTRGGEGLNLAVDQLYTLHREKEQSGAWLEMIESRYTAYHDVGTENEPGIWLRKVGPYFSDEPPPLADHSRYAE